MHTPLASSAPLQFLFLSACQPHATAILAVLLCTHLIFGSLLLPTLDLHIWLGYFFSFSFSSFFFFFFCYGDLQKWLQMVLWCHSDTGLVSSADESNPTSINTFLIDAILLQMCYCSRLIAEFRDMFVVRAHSLAINWHLGKPILLAYVPRIYRSCHLCDTNPLMLCFTALIWLY